MLFCAVAALYRDQTTLFTTLSGKRKLNVSLDALVFKRIWPWWSCFCRRSQSQKWGGRWVLLICHHRNEVTISNKSGIYWQLFDTTTLLPTHLHHKSKQKFHKQTRLRINRLKYAAVDILYSRSPSILEEEEERKSFSGFPDRIVDHFIHVTDWESIKGKIGYHVLCGILYGVLLRPLARKLLSIIQLVPDTFFLYCFGSISKKKHTTGKVPRKHKRVRRLRFFGPEAAPCPVHLCHSTHEKTN